MHLVQMYKALADDSRLRILRVLLSGRFSVAELQVIVGMGQSRVSRHLKLLLDAGLVRVERQGTWAYYEAADGQGDENVSSQLELLRQRAHLLPGGTDDESRRLACLERRRQKSQAFHDRVASQWACLRTELLGDGAVTARVLESVQGASSVADLGCGPGAMLGELAHQTGKVIGVDSSPAMLDEARKSLDGEVSPRIQLRLGALEHLPLADGEVDAALMNMVLHHLADPPVVLREVKRILAPRGRLVICDLARHGEEWMRERYGDQWLGFTTQELRRFLERAGFETLSINRYDAPRAGILVAVAQAGNGGER